jgi:hypothetical protein
MAMLVVSTLWLAWTSDQPALLGAATLLSERTVISKRKEDDWASSNWRGTNTRKTGTPVVIPP